MPGFPPSDHAPTTGIAARQFGNAAFGFVAAALALLPLFRPQRHIPKILKVLHVLFHLGGGLAIMAGSAGLALRVVGLAASLGPPPNGLLGPLVAALGLFWAGAWLALAWAVWREGWGACNRKHGESTVPPTPRRRAAARLRPRRVALYDRRKG